MGNEQNVLYVKCFHRAKDSTEKRNAIQITECDPNEVEDCKVTLLTNEEPSTNEIFVLESLRSAVIDTACTRTLCGEKWFNLFCEEVDDAVPTVNIRRAFVVEMANWYTHFSVHKYQPLLEIQNVTLKQRL